MSGPWDRPSSPGPEDRDWPAEDFESSSPAQPSNDPWSAEDPWGEAPRDDSSAWDVWPPPAPTTDDYVIEEPAPPASDPWAESWADDVPGIPAAADRAAPPEPAPAPDAGAPQFDDASYAGPRVEPWAPDTDPWGTSEAEPWRPAEPWRDEVESAAPPAEPSAPIEPASPPDMPAEPAPRFADELATPEPYVADEVAQPEPEFADEVPEPAPEFADAVSEPIDEFEAAPATAGATETTPADFYRSIFPAPVAPAADDIVPDERAELEPVEPSLEPIDAEAEAAPKLIEPVWEPDLWEPELEPDMASSVVDAPPVEVPAPEPEPEPEFEPEAEAEPEREQEFEPEPEPEPEAEPAPEPESEPEPEPSIAAVAASVDDWQPEPWQHQAESTQVLPTSWAPHAPEPSADRETLDAQIGRIRTSLGAGEDVDTDDELAANPSTAEQAVPWLIGVILLLAGMVIVLLALIFAGDGSLGGAGSQPSPTPAGFVPVASSEDATPSPSADASVTPVVSAPPTASSSPGPEYGALEMVYQGRSAALAPIYLLHRDFTIDEEPETLAQDATLDVRGFAWAPDGTVGAGLYADLLISIEPGKEKRNLGDGIVSVTFGDDASTLYAVRITEDGANDVATILQIDYASGEQTEVAAIDYPRPDIAEESAPLEAQFADDGGSVRLFWMNDNTLRLWSLGAGSWRVDPASGDVTDMDDQLPVLWSPGAVRRITLAFDDGVTTVRLHDGDDEAPVATTTVEGYVSHVRWSPDGEIVSFTVGTATGSDGVLQDLYAWYLGDGEEPMRLTNTGAAFGAEWRGSTPRWEDD